VIYFVVTVHSIFIFCVTHRINRTSLFKFSRCRHGNSRLRKFDTREIATVMDPFADLSMFSCTAITWKVITSSHSNYMLSTISGEEEPRAESNCGHPFPLHDRRDFSTLSLNLISSLISCRMYKFQCNLIAVWRFCYRLN